MVEWHITPEYILDNWTDEQFDLMIEKLVERKERETKKPPDPGVSVEMLAAQSGGMIEMKRN